MVHKVTVEGREMDLDKFRLRNFVGRLAELGELEVHEEPVALADLSHAIENSSKAQLYKNVGAEHFEVVAATAGSRKRLAAALGVEPAKAVSEFARRLDTPQPVVTIQSADAPVHQVIKTGDLHIDLQGHEVTWRGGRILLTATEFKILQFLASRPGRVFSRDEIIDAASGNDAAVFDRTVDVHITALRRKLGAGAEHIETVRGFGYKFRATLDVEKEHV